MAKGYFSAVFSHDKSEINSLNGIRAILIFVLFFGHMYSMASDSGKMLEVHPLLKNLSRNVTFILDIFFVLSGYLISAPLFREIKKTGTISLKFFYIRRTLRIFPPYYIFLILQTFMIFAMARMVNTPEHQTVADTMISRLKFDYLYLSNYFPCIMLHGWSLSLEEQFYIFFPLFLFFGFRFLPSKFQLPSLVALYLIPLAFRFYIYYSQILPIEGNIMHIYEDKIYRPFHTHADSIFAGIFISYIIENKKHWLDFVVYESGIGKWIHVGAWVVLLSFNVFSYELSKSIFNQVLRFNINNITTCIILLYSLKPGLITSFFSLGIFSPIAKLSYIAYLLHMLLLGYLMYPLAQKPSITFSDILLYWLPFSFVIFFFSYLFHLVAEWPFMYLKDYITAQYKKEAIPRI